jgi:hypothetical protein
LRSERDVGHSGSPELVEFADDDWAFGNRAQLSDSNTLIGAPPRVRRHRGNRVTYADDSSPRAGSILRRFARALNMRVLTVFTGQPAIAAMSWYEHPAKSVRSTTARGGSA